MIFTFYTVYEVTTTDHGGIKEPFIPPCTDLPKVRRAVFIKKSTIRIKSLFGPVKQKFCRTEKKSLT